MLHILLLILKIIGIILLVILGILVLLVSAVLFVPIRYEFQAKRPDENGTFFLKISASYFLRFAYAYYKYENEKSDWQARVAWVKSNKKKKKKKRKHRPEKETEKAQESAQGNTQDRGTQEENTQEKKVEKKAVKHTKKTKQSWYKRMKNRIKVFCKKIKAAYEKKEKLSNYLEDETHRSAFEKIKREVGKLAKRIKPRHINGKVHFGLWNPYRTGQVLAFLSVLYPFYGDNLQIYPDFDEEVYEGDIYIKGCIRVIFVAIFIINIFFDKEIRKTYRDAKKMKLI